MPSSIVMECSRVMARQEVSVAFVESATAGRLCYEFSRVPDSGRIFKGGLICYDVCLKEDILGISTQLIDQYTPESAEVTEELAKRLGSFIQSDIAAAVTGLVTPGGSETPDKPVGTMFVHILTKKRSIASRTVFTGSPEQIVMQTVDEAAQLILNVLSTHESA